MRRIVCAALAFLMISSAVSCGRVAPAEVSATSSAAEFLVDRLGVIPEGVILGDAEIAESYGVDMSEFEDDGYLLRTLDDKTLVFGKTEDGLDRAVRKYAKAVQNDTADTLNETYHEGYRIERLTLAGRDLSEYTVYYPETANENMKFASDELVRLVKKATGVELPVVVGEAVAPAIELRHTNDPALETDGFNYFVTEDGLVIEGAVERGCMNGVWRFLQHEFDWDFLIYGDSYLNESEHVDIPVGTACTEDPSCEHFDMWNRYDNFPKENECTVPTAEQNSYGVIGRSGHSIFHYYEGSSAEKHPCYTNEDFWDETLENIRKYVAKNYGTPGFKSVNIGQNDDFMYCQCVSCLEVLAEEGSNSGAVVRHANYVSEEINKEYPGLAFLILAYAGSNIPPKKTAPNEWVYITYCMDWNCTNHKFDGSDCKDLVYFYGTNNKNHDEWLRGWIDLGANVYVYAYNLDNTFDHYTIINNVYDDYRYLRDIGVKGIGLEGSAYGNWGIKRIEQEMISEVNWDYNMTREEFTELYHTALEHEYGDGWEKVLEYIDGWEKSQDISKCWSWWGMRYDDPSTRFFDTGFYAERFDTFLELIDSAMYEANSAEQEERILRLSVSVLYKGCFASYFFEYLEGDEERIQVLSDRYDRCMNTVIGFGDDPTDIIGYFEGNRIHYRLNLHEEAWSKWAPYFTTITGQPLPEGAPVIETTEVD